MAIRIIKSKEYDLNDLWIQRDRFYKRIECRSASSAFDVVPLSSVMVAVYIFCAGVFLSVLFILLEITRKKVARTHQILSVSLLRRSYLKFVAFEPEKLLTCK